MEVVCTPSAEWTELACYYPRFNALFPKGTTNANIRYISSIESLKSCAWLDQITFANVMSAECAEFIASNPTKFPLLRCVVLSGHDICADKPLAVPDGFARLPALTMLGFEYCSSCQITSQISNIRELYLNELSTEIQQQIANTNWVEQWLPECKDIIWY